MTRLRRIPREELGAEQAQLFDVIAGSERPGQRPRYPRVGRDNALEGPFNALLRSPAIGLALQRFGDALRYDSTLTDRSREFAILSVAAALKSEYETDAHQDIARAVGVTDSELASISAGKVPETASTEEQAVISAAQLLINTSDLDDDQYAAAIEALGERRLFEVATLVGMYSMIALNLRVFRVEPPAEHEYPH